MSIEENLICHLSDRLVHFSPKKTAYKFQCPYCQVGRKNGKGKAFTPSEASGYLYQARDGWNFKCHREKHCGRGTSFAIFLEENFPEEFLKYVRVREEKGTSGYQTNCPSLATALIRKGVLPNCPPKFHDPSRLRKRPEPPSEAPVSPLENAVPPKVTKLPPMRSPQQQAGHQAIIARKVKEYHLRHHREPGDFYL